MGPPPANGLEGEPFEVGELVFVEVSEVEGVGEAQELDKGGCESERSSESSNVGSNLRGERQLSDRASESVGELEIATQLVGEGGDLKKRAHNAGERAEGLWDLRSG